MTTAANPVVQQHSRLRQLSVGQLQEYYSGRKLWGDDFTLAEICEWYQMEENACFEIYQDRGQIAQGTMPNNDYLHWKYGYESALAGRASLGRVLGLGSGNGEEFRPVRKFIEHLHIVESAEGYFKDDTATTYAKAQADGTLQFAADFFDTAVNIAVLHHIPNLSHVVRELYRVAQARRHLPRQGTHHHAWPVAAAAQGRIGSLRTRLPPRVAGKNHDANRL